MDFFAETSVVPAESGQIIHKHAVIAGNIQPVGRRVKHEQIVHLPAVIGSVRHLLPDQGDRVTGVEAAHAAQVKTVVGTGGVFGNIKETIAAIGSMMHIDHVVETGRVDRPGGAAIRREVEIVD